MAKLDWKSLGFIYAFCLIVAAILLLAFYGWWNGKWESAEGAEGLYQGVPIDAHLVELDKKALEAAYEQQLMLLFSVWLKDDISVVHRINNGLKNSRRAYIEAAKKIEEREALSKSGEVK